MVLFFFLYIIHPQKRPTELARKTPQFPWGAKLEAFTVILSPSYPLFTVKVGLATHDILLWLPLKAYNHISICFSHGRQSFRTQRRRTPQTSQDWCRWASRPGPEESAEGPSGRWWPWARCRPRGARRWACHSSRRPADWSHRPRPVRSLSRRWRIGSGSPAGTRIRKRKRYSQLLYAIQIASKSSVLWCGALSSNHTSPPPSSKLNDLNEWQWRAEVMETETTWDYGRENADLGAESWSQTANEEIVTPSLRQFQCSLLYSRQLTHFKVNIPSTCNYFK